MSVVKILNKVRQIPRGTNAWFSDRDVDPGRAVMAGAECAMTNMIGEFGDKWFMIFRYTELVRWMVRGKEGIEKTVESAFTYEANISNLHGTGKYRRTGLPQGTTVRRILGPKPPAKDIVVGH
jgi:hypothetical protein